MILKIECIESSGHDELARSGIWPIGQIVPLVLQRLGVVETVSRAKYPRAQEPWTPAQAVAETLVSSF